MKDNTLGKNIKRLRKEKGLRQKELAGELYMSGHTLCNYETGMCDPSLDTLIKLAHLLNTDPNSLLGWEESKE